MRLAPALAAALSAVAVALLGCGDDDGVTLEEWVAEADELCKRGDAEQEVAVRGYFEREGISPRQPPTAAQLEQLATEVVVPNIQAFLEQAQSDLDRIAAEPSLINQANPFGETTKLADGLGLAECAQ